MHRIDRLNGSGSARLLAALLLCVLFLLLTVSLVRVGFESNDDLTLAAFVDGQMAVPTAHIPYLNIVIAALLKGVYRVLGQGAPWHTLGQYALLLAGFTALGAVLNARLGVLPKKYAAQGEKTFRGIVDKYLSFKDGQLNLGGICLVAGLGPENNRRRDGSYEYYISEPVVENDAKGVAPFVLCYTEIKRLGGA